MKIYTNAELLEMVHADRETNMLALNGLLEDAAKLPAVLKDTVTRLRDDLNSKLRAMQPLDQVPAAEQAAYALNRLVDGYNYAQDSLKAAIERIAKIAADYNVSQTALNGFTDREQKGELVSKAAAAELVANAKAEEQKTFGVRLGALRKEMIALFQLPAAPDDVLSLADDAFSARLATCKATVATLTGRGLKADGVVVKECAWLEQTALNGRMAMIDEVSPRANGGGDPLLGGPGAEGGEKKADTGLVLV